MNKKIYKELKIYFPIDDYEINTKEIMLDFVKNNRDVLTRNNRIGHFTVSAWIINEKKDKVLMIYHNIYKSWSWVGGHLDGNDNLLEVIKREIYEETSLTDIKLLVDGIYGINIIGVDQHIKNNQIITSHLHFDIVFLFEAKENSNIKINR